MKKEQKKHESKNDVKKSKNGNKSDTQQDRIVTEVEFSKISGGSGVMHIPGIGIEKDLQ